MRLKTVLFLQGSTLYDPEAVRTRLSPHAKILKLESAILEGKVRYTSIWCGWDVTPSPNHSSAITALRSPSWCTT